MPKPGDQVGITDNDLLRWNATWELLKNEDPPWTLDQLGAKVGLSKSDLSKILNGHHRRTGAQEKAALDRILGSAPENTPVGRKLLGIIEKLDDVRQERLLERAEALLDEQRRVG